MLAWRRQFLQICQTNHLIQRPFLPVPAFAWVSGVAQACLTWLFWRWDGIVACTCCTGGQRKSYADQAPSVQPSDRRLAQALLTARWVCARRKLLFLSGDQVPSAARRCHNTRTEQGRSSFAKPFELGPRSSISRSATASQARYHSSIDLPGGLLVKLRYLSPRCHYIEPPDRPPSGPESALVFTRLVTPHSLTTFALLAQCI